MSEYHQLLSGRSEPERFVRETLRQLELDFRRIGLLALVDWHSTGLTSDRLFAAIGTLQRPSWGSWNGLIGALRNARREILRGGTIVQREAVQRAVRLTAVLELLDEPVTAVVTPEAVRRFAELLHLSPPGKARLGGLFAMAITLRNRIAHDLPTSETWWRDTADAISPFIELLAEHDTLSSITLPTPAPRPWFDERSGVVAHFNGLTSDGNVIYVPSTGDSYHSDDASASVLLALKQLLGKAQLQEDDFRKLLGRLAPQDVRGVLMGDYLVAEPVGLGGYGTVHRGVQLSTGRAVAVKVLRDNLDEDARLRFHQEARFLSQLDHPNIVSVYAFGTDPWTAPREFSLADEAWYADFAQSNRRKWWIALEWIEGETLDQIFQRRSLDRPSTGDLVHWFLQAATALLTVHVAGLIHRDVKPSNLMVTGEGVIKLMDFGIARVQSEHRTIVTQDGLLPGTPAYMSPEQLRSAGADAEVGPSTDIYSLCATFYELFTGLRLFEHATRTPDAVRADKLAGVRPERTAAGLAGLSWEIRTVLLGGLEPEITDRPGSMRQLQSDLERIANDEPISYKRPSLRRRVQLGYRRNRREIHLTLFLTVIAIGALSAGAVKYVQDLRREETRTRSAAITSVRRLDQQYTANGSRLLESPRWLDSLPWFAESAGLIESPDSVLVDPERSRMHRVRLGLLLRSAPELLRSDSDHHGTPIFSPDGRRIALVSGDNVDILDGTSLNTVAGPLEHSDPVLRVVFHPTGKLVATTSGDRTGRNGKGFARIWDVETGRPATDWLEHEGNAKPSVRQAPSDYKILHAGLVVDAAFSPDGELLATASDSRTVRIWDVATGGMIGASMDHPDAVTSVTFHPRGNMLLTSCADGMARLWDVTAQAQLGESIPHDTLTEPPKFNPLGTSLVVIQDKTAQMLSMEDRTRIGDSISDGSDVHAVHFGVDGRSLLVIARNASARVWHIDDNRWLGPRMAHEGIRSAIFTSYGESVMTIGDGVRVWHTITGSPATPRIGFSSFAAASADGRRFAISDRRGLSLWQRGIAQIRTDGIVPAWPRNVDVDPNERCVLVRTDDSDRQREVRVYELFTNAEPIHLEHDVTVRDAQFVTIDGPPRVVTVSSEAYNSPNEPSELRIWNIGSNPATFRRIECDQSVVTANISPDGLAAAVVLGEGGLRTRSNGRAGRCDIGTGDGAKCSRRDARPPGNAIDSTNTHYDGCADPRCVFYAGRIALRDCWWFTG